MATGWSAEFDIKYVCVVCVFARACVCVCARVCTGAQFQAGGDPKTGVARSAQEAQAQAILQQTTVLKI